MSRFKKFRSLSSNFRLSPSWPTVCAIKQRNDVDWGGGLSSNDNYSLLDEKYIQCQSAYGVRSNIGPAHDPFHI
jgi:hypothetical protein